MIIEMCSRHDGRRTADERVLGPAQRGFSAVFAEAAGEAGCGAALDSAVARAHGGGISIRNVDCAPRRHVEWALHLHFWLLADSAGVAGLARGALDLRESIQAARSGRASGSSPFAASTVHLREVRSAEGRIDEWAARWTWKSDFRVVRAAVGGRAQVSLVFGRLADVHGAMTLHTADTSRNAPTRVHTDLAGRTEPE